MKRRSFIKASTLVTVPVLINGIPVNAIARNSFLNLVNGDDDRVLVLVQLGGGNDGLNMVLPLDQYSGLTKIRQKILIDEASVLKLTDKTGIHPAMTGMKNLFDDGKLKLIQSVGYPNQNRSHFRSTDIWTSGSDATVYESTGWLGRHFAEIHPNYPTGYPNSQYPDPQALTLGSLVSDTCQGPVTNFSLALNDPTTLKALTEGEKGSLPNTNYGNELAFMINAIRQTNAYSDTIGNAYDKAATLSTKYPTGNALADKLKIVARLVNGGLKTKVYVVTLTGFDTHANQIDVTDDKHITGNHADLLKTLSDAIEAFQDDLKLMGIEKRVVGMTFSEFGRRIKANDSSGTDHGTAAPLFVFGSCINPMILGDNPTISSNVTDDEGVAMQIDFRSIYASLLIDWFKVDSNIVKDILFHDFQKLAIIEGCDTSTGVDDYQRDFSMDFVNYPNPVRNQTTLSFNTKEEQIRISLFDSIGSELAVLYNGKMNAGKHEMNIDTSMLSGGNYFIRIVSTYAQKTKSFVKN